MKYIEVKEDNRLRQFMLGSILGDGSIPKKDKNAVNYRLTLGHCSKQLPYLEWKVNLLKEYGLSTGVITKVTAKSSRYIGGECISYHMKAKAHPYFSIYRNKYYMDNKKIIDDSIKSLDDFGLAIWYMDDGYATDDKLRNKTFYRIATDSFNKCQLDMLVDMLKSNFDINTTINYGRELRISEYDNDKFISIIKPHILPIFNYKIRVLNKQGELLEHPTSVGGDNQQPSLTSNSFEGSTTNSQVLLNKDGNANTSALQPISESVVIERDVNGKPLMSVQWIMLNFNK